MKIRGLVIVLISCFLVAGCATQQVDFQPDLPKNSQKLDAELVYDQWHGFVLFASQNLKGPIDVGEYCSRENLVRIENETTPPQVIASLLSPIYIAQQSRIYCER
jgi:hypothetical protein